VTNKQDHMRAVAARLDQTALDPTLWPEIMEEISRAIGATGAVLLQSDVRTPDVPHTAGVAEVLQAYFGANWHLRDIRARAAPLLVKGQKRVITDHDSVTLDEMRNGEYYNELLRPFGMRWFAAVGFWAGAAPWALSIHRNAREGPFEEADRRILEQLSPKLSEAATLSTAVGRVVLSGVGNALDLCGQPAMALDRMGAVLHVNAAADRLFDNGIRVRNRQLIVQDHKARRLLDQLIAWLRNSSEHVSAPHQTIFVRSSNASPILIHVLPVPPGARGPFLGARVMLTLSRLRTTARTNPNLLMQAFELTHSEARLAAFLGDGGTLAEAAQHFGTSLSTVRNQLKAVFVKTETHRQGELVAALSTLKIPDQGLLPAI
jgi:DNA-binding CsgD family transcriptional regulator